MLRNAGCGMGPAFQPQGQYKGHVCCAVDPDRAAGSAGGASTVPALRGSQTAHSLFASAQSPLPATAEPDPDPVLDLR